MNIAKTNLKNLKYLFNEGEISLNNILVARVCDNTTVHYSLPGMTVVNGGCGK